MKLWVEILIGFALGAIVGLIVGPSIAVIKLLGDLFIRPIKMLIVPMVFCSLVVGASSIGNLKKLGRVGGKTVLLLLGNHRIRDYSGDPVIPDNGSKRGIHNRRSGNV